MQGQLQEHNIHVQKEHLEVLQVEQNQKIEQCANLAINVQMKQLLLQLIEELENIAHLELLFLPFVRLVLTQQIQITQIQEVVQSVQQVITEVLKD